jgi:hypothetical protein
LAIGSIGGLAIAEIAIGDLVRLLNRPPNPIAIRHFRNRQSMNGSIANQLPQSPIDNRQ